MSNKTQLSTNNTQLASLIQTLQGKAAGGGGASVETCSVTIKGNIGKARASTYGNGEYGVAEGGAAPTVTFDNVVKGSMVIVVENGMGGSPTFTNATQYEQFYMDDFAMNYIYIAIAGE